MTWLRVIFSRFTAHFSRNRLEREMNEEINAHLEMLCEENLRRGMSPQEARRAARRSFGGPDQLKESCRDLRGIPLLETTIQDLAYGLRTLRKSPGFAAVAVLTLALGIGANTAIFSVVNTVLLRPFPYLDADRLVVILHHGDDPVAPANYLDWRRQNHVFERMGAADWWTPNLTGVDRPEQIHALRLSSDILPLLGIQPVLGRVFIPEEEERGREHEVILSYRLWQRRFAGDSGVIGRTIILDGETFVVIGVMPRSFKFAPFWATKAELWAPLALGDRAASREGSSLRLFARLKPGVTLNQAQAEMATITAQLERVFPGTNREVVVRSLKEKVVGDVRPGLWVLLGAVGFVLLIACANIAHMLLARAAARQKEIAIRTALGAGRARVIRQFLAESALLAVLGGSAGLLLAVWGIRVLLAFSPEDIPRLDGIALDSRALAFTALVTLATGLAFGIVPAMRASALNASDVLKENGRGSTAGIRHGRLRSLLVISEFALALVLLAGAGLMVRSFVALQAVDPGFDPRNLMTMVISVAGTQEGEPRRRAEFYQQIIRQVRTLPHVQSAGAINHLPLAGDLWGWPFWVEGRPIPGPGDAPGAVYRVILPGYFRTMGIPILRGRDINDGDNLNAPAVVIINQRLAQRFWPGEDPVGKRITLDDPRKKTDWLVVVGVAGDSKQGDWTIAPTSEVFLPFLQNRRYLEGPALWNAYLTLVVRSSGDPAPLAAAVEGEVRRLDKNVTISEIQTMGQVVADSTGRQRFFLFLLSTFAATALILAGVGIYGVISYSVQRRVHEIGIRLALGAGKDAVIRMVVGGSLLLALAGTGAGLAAALALTPLMSTLLYGVQAADPATFVSVSLILIGIALGAGYFPARRATRVDAVTALRQE